MLSLQSRKFAGVILGTKEGLFSAVHAELLNSSIDISVKILSLTSVFSMSYATYASFRFSFHQWTNRDEPHVGFSPTTTKHHYSIVP